MMICQLGLLQQFLRAIYQKKKKKVKTNITFKKNSTDICHTFICKLERHIYFM